jgi:hypothetical protein
MVIISTYFGNNHQHHCINRGGFFMKYVLRRSIGSLFFLLLLFACSLPVTKVDIQSFGLEKPDVTKDQALASLTNIFVNRGFDIKFANKEAGLVTTEYKKFASMGDKPPFDYYMQIKGRINEDNDNVKITLTPIVKSQNRMNAADFSERELSYFTGDAPAVNKIRSMRENVGWRAIGQMLFMNVVHDTAETYGLTVEELTQNVTKTPSTTSEADE